MRSLLTLTKLGFRSLLFTSTGTSFSFRRTYVIIFLYIPYSGYDKIKNWFSNTRQKDAMQWRTANPSITEQYNLASTLRNANIEGREMKLRPQALDHCAEGGWSDGFFYEVVLVNDWKMVGRSWEQRMREDAAYGLLELGLRGLP